MKKTKILLGSSVLLAGITALSIIINPSKKGNNRTNAVDIPDYTWDNVITCENWANSGKGFQFDFTYTKANEGDDSISLCPMGKVNGNDIRITSGYPIKINVSATGLVTSTYGNVIKNDDNTYTFSMMFDEVASSAWNTSQGITGTETITKIYFRWGGVQLTKLRSSLINSTMNVSPRAEVRDEETDNTKGLMFKSYVPKIVTGAKYGMAIVPNEYLGSMTDDYLETLTANGKAYSSSYCNPLQITSSDGYMYERYNSGYYIKCTLSTKEANYMRDFSAIPFEEIDGNRTYAWNINEEKDNLYEACSRVRNDSSLSADAQEYVHNVLSSVENKAASLSTSSVNAYIVENTDQILKNQALSNAETTLGFKAAKGETETAQLILKSTSSNLSYFVGMSDLINGSNIITSNNVEIDMEHYVNITSNWSSFEEHTSWQSQLYPDGAVVSTLGWWPDALIPMDIAVRDGRNVINTTNGANQGLFFRINVPADAAAGTYTGNVLINIVGQGTISVPVSLTVYNFSIANRTDAQTIINLSKSEVSALYGMNYNNVCDSPEYSSAYELLGDRGVSGGLIPVSWFNTNLDKYVATLKELKQTSKSKNYLLDFNTQNVKMDWKFNKTIGTRTINLDEDIFLADDDGDKKGLKTILRTLFDASTNELDLLEGAIIYDPHADEPSSPGAYIRNLLNFNSLRRSIDAVLADVASVTGKDKVKQSLNDVFYLMTAGPEQGISGKENDYAFCDVKSISNVTGGDKSYCNSLDAITYRSITDFTPNMMWVWNSGTNWKERSYKDDQGNPESSCGYCYDGLAGIYAGTDTTNRMWEYTCVQPVGPYPSYTLNTPMIKTRANRWREFNLNMEGFFFYMANRTQYHFSDETPEQVMTEEQILNGGIYYGGASSDGLLMYPVRDMFGYANRNLYWLSSLRLENTSEGNDDLNYLYLAKELIAQKANPTTYQARLTNICNTLSVDNCPAKVTNSSSILKTARENLVALINELMA